VLIRRRKHRLLASIASQALANSLSPTPRTHLIAASALLDSARPREAARRLALASCSASRGLWDALLRRTCTGRGEPRYTLELLSTAVDDHGASLSPSTTA
jgi:leucine-rich PPR motif-containing protein, mitochondrial